MATIALASGQAMADDWGDDRWGDDHLGDGEDECPPNDWDDVFGEGAEDLTTCLQYRRWVRPVYQLNDYCAFGARGEHVNGQACSGNRAYGLGNMKNAIADYQFHGVRDADIVAVVYSRGGFLLLNDKPARENVPPLVCFQTEGAAAGCGEEGAEVAQVNWFESDVQDLMDQGVTFYFCLNTVRAFVNAGILPAAGTWVRNDGSICASGEQGCTEVSALDYLIDGVQFVPSGVTAIADFQIDGRPLVHP